MLFGHAPLAASLGDAAAPSSAVATSGAHLAAPLRHDSATSNIDTSATAKVRQFLSSIEGAKSAPAKPSSHILRRPAVKETPVADSDDTSAVASDLGLASCPEGPAAEESCGASPNASVLSKSQVRALIESSGNAELKELYLGKDASATAAGQVHQTEQASGARAIRSKAAVPLFRYLRDGGTCGNGMSASDDANASLEYSCHLQPAADGRGLAATDTQVLAAAAKLHTHTPTRTLPLFDHCSQNRSPVAVQPDSPRPRLPLSTHLAAAYAPAAATRATALIPARGITQPAQALQRAKRPMSAGIMMRPVVRYLGCEPRTWIF